MSATKGHRLPLHERPGSKLDLSKAVPVVVTVNGREQIHGYIDHALGVFQGGGATTEILNMRDTPPLLSCVMDVWREMTAAWNNVKTWEMIDHTERVVYTIPIERALVVKRFYWVGPVERVGVPVTFCDRIDAAGTVLYQGLPAPNQGRIVFGEVDPRQYRKK